MTILNTPISHPKGAIMPDQAEGLREIMEEKKCPECDGEGTVTVGPINCGGPRPYAISPEYVEETCEDCNGTGIVEECEE